MQEQKARWSQKGVLGLLTFFAVTLASHCLYQYLADPYRFPITTVKIEAPFLHVSHEKIQSLLEPYLSLGFFGFSHQKLQEEILSIPWVKNVSVERVWKDGIKIVILEKKPIAFWNEFLLDEEGEIFDVGEERREFILPHLQSKANHRQEVLQVYKKLSKILARCELNVSTLDWQENDALELELSSGQRLYLGKQDNEMRVQRFCRALPIAFGNRFHELLSVDLRYPHGMAVHWKK